MFNKLITLAAATSLAASPAMAASSASTLSVQPPEHSQGRAVGNPHRRGGNPLTAPGAGFGIAAFTAIIVLGVLLATGTLFGDDDRRPISA
jgi:hypothetical protein